MSDVYTEAEKQELGISQDVGKPSTNASPGPGTYTPEELGQIGITNEGAPTNVSGPPPDLLTEISNRAALVSGHFQHGEEETAIGMAYQRAALGFESYDSVKARVEPEALMQLRAQKMSALEHLVPPNDMTRFILPAVDQLAFTKHIFEATAAGQVTGGAAGASLGALGATPFSVAAGGLAGITYGGAAGAFTYGTAVSHGQSYRKLRELGVPDEKAKQLSLGVGVVQGAVGALQVHLMGAMFRSAVGSVMKKEAGTALLNNAVLRYLGLIGAEGVGGATQEAAQLVAEHTAGVVQTKKDQPEFDAWMERLAQSAMTQAQMAVVLGAGAHVTGKVTGHALEHITKDSTNPFLADIHEVLQANKAAARYAKIKREETIAKLFEPKTETKVTGRVVNGPNTVEEAAAQADRSPQTVAATDALAGAIESRDTAKANVKALENEAISYTDNNQKVPPELKQNLKEARAAYDYAAQDVKRAELTLAKEEAQDLASTPKRAQAERTALNKTEAAAAKVLRGYRVEELKLLESGQPVPASLKQSIAESKEALRLAVENKKARLLQIDAEVLADELAQPGMSDDDRAAVLVKAQAVEEKLKDLQKVQIAVSTRNRLRNVNKRIVELQATIEEKVKVVKADLKSQIAALRAKIKKIEEYITKEFKPGINFVGGGMMLKEAQATHDANKAKLEELKTLQGNIEAAYDATNKGDFSQADVLIDNLDNARGAINELHALHDERETLGTLKDLTDTNLLSSKDMRSLNVSINALSAQKLVGYAVEKMLAVARDTKVDTKKRIKTVQTLVTKIIKKSGLSTADQGQFLSVVKDIQTEEQLKAVFDDHISEGEKTKGQVTKGLLTRIAEAMEARAMKEAMHRLHAVLNKIDPKAKGKLKESKYDFDSQQTLSTYKALIKDALLPPDKTKNLAGKVLAQSEKELHDNAEALDKAANPVGTLAKAIGAQPPDVVLLNPNAIIAQDVFNLRNKDAAAVDALAQTLEGIVKTGKENRLEKKLAEQKHLDELLTKSINAANGSKPLYTEYVDKKGVVHRKMNRMNAAHRYLRRHSEVFGMWNTLTDNIFQDSPHEADRHLLDLHDEVQTEEDNIAMTTNVAVDTITNGEARLMRALVRVAGSSETKEKLPGYVSFERIGTDGDGNPIYEKIFIDNTEMSRDTAIQLRNMMRNPVRQIGLAFGNKFTFIDNAKNPVKLLDGEVSTEQMLENHLNQDEKDLGDNALLFYSGSNYDRINEAHIDEFALPLPKVNFYEGPSVRSKQADEGSALDLRVNFQDRRSLAPGSFVELKTSTDAYRLRGFANTLNSYIATTEHWMAWRKKEKELRHVLSNPVMREIIEGKLSGDSIKIIDHSYMSIVGTRGMQHVQRVKLISYLRGHSATSFTGGKPLNALAQFSGVLNYLTPDGVNAIELTHGLVDFWAHPGKAIKILSNTKFMRNRAGFLINEFTEARQQESMFGVTKNTSVAKFFQGLITKFDRWTILWGGWSVYRVEYNKVLKAADNKELAHDKAVAKFERVSNRLQGSSTPDQITHFERNGDVAKLLTLFGKQPMQAYQAELVAIRRAMSNPSGGSIARAAQAVLGAHLAQAAFQAIISAVAYNTTEDEKEKRTIEAKVAREFILGPRLPLIGDAINAAATFVTNEMSKDNEEGPNNEPLFGPKFAAADMLDAGFVKFPQHTYALAQKYAEDGEVDTVETYKALEAWSRSWALLSPTWWALGGGGVPLPAIIKTAKTYQEYIDPGSTKLKGSVSNP